MSVGEFAVKQRESLFRDIESFHKTDVQFVSFSDKKDPNKQIQFPMGKSPQDEEWKYTSTETKATQRLKKQAGLVPGWI